MWFRSSGPSQLRFRHRPTHCECPFFFLFLLRRYRLLRFSQKGIHWCENVHTVATLSHHHTVSVDLGEWASLCILPPTQSSTNFSDTTQPHPQRGDLSSIGVSIKWVSFQSERPGEFPPPKKCTFLSGLRVQARVCINSDVRPTPSLRSIEDLWGISLGLSLARPIQAWDSGCLSAVFLFIHLHTHTHTHLHKTFPANAN